jgi:hypothetical protein
MDALADYYLWKGVPAGANLQYRSLKAEVTQWPGNGKRGAGFTVAGQTTLPPAYQTALTRVLAANWQ